MRRKPITDRQWLSLGILAAAESVKTAQAGNEVASEYYKRLAEQCDLEAVATRVLKAVS